MRPRFSWTTGPVGISLRLGAEPLACGTVLQIRLALSPDQAQGLEKTPLRETPGTRWASADATSTIQRLSPASVGLSLAWTKETWRASGDQAGKRIFGSGGIPEIGFASPFGSACSISDVMYRPRLGPFVRGLKRSPAKRNSGCARSAIVGRPEKDSINSQRAPVLSWGETSTRGVGRVSTRSMIACGGFWYSRLVWARMLENEGPRRIAVRAANLRTGIEPMKSTSFLLCVRESLGPFEGNILLRNCGSGKGFEKIVPRGKVGPGGRERSRLLETPDSVSLLRTLKMRLGRSLSIAAVAEQISSGSGHSSTTPERFAPMALDPRDARSLSCRGGCMRPDRDRAGAADPAYPRHRYVGGSLQKQGGTGRTSRVDRERPSCGRQGSEDLRGHGSESLAKWRPAAARNWRVPFSDRVGQSVPRPHERGHHLRKRPHREYSSEE